MGVGDPLGSIYNPKAPEALRTPSAIRTGFDQYFDYLTSTGAGGSVPADSIRAPYRAPLGNFTQIASGMAITNPLASAPAAITQGGTNFGAATGNSANNIQLSRALPHLRQVMGDAAFADWFIYGKNPPSDQQLLDSMQYSLQVDKQEHEAREAGKLGKIAGVAGFGLAAGTGLLDKAITSLARGGITGIGGGSSNVATTGLSAGGSTPGGSLGLLGAENLPIAGASGVLTPAGVAAGLPGVSVGSTLGISAIKNRIASALGQSGANSVVSQSGIPRLPGTGGSILNSGGGGGSVANNDLGLIGDVLDISGASGTLTPQGVASGLVDALGSGGGILNTIKNLGSKLVGGGGSGGGSGLLDTLLGIGQAGLGLFGTISNANALDDALDDQSDSIRAQTKLIEQITQIAKEDWDRFKQVYQPLENELVADVRQGVQPDYEGLDARPGTAARDVTDQYERSRNVLMRNLGRYGGRPDSGQFRETMRIMGTDEARDRAAAATRARFDVEDQKRTERKYADETTFNRQSGVLSLGRGLPSQSASNLSAAASGLSDVARQQGGRANLFADATAGAADALGGSIYDLVNKDGVYSLPEQNAAVPWRVRAPSIYGLSGIG